jgi:hypothetical protein
MGFELIGSAAAGEIGIPGDEIVAALKAIDFSVHGQGRPLLSALSPSLL